MITNDDDDQVRRQTEVNYTGPVMVTRLCTPLLVRGRGRLVNMISNCTECPLPTLGPYTASKVRHQKLFNKCRLPQAALLAISDVLRAELSRYNVSVIIVNPGDAPHHTPLTAHQATHFTHMEDNMTRDQRLIFGKMFDQCRDYYNKQFPAPPPLHKIVNDSYYRTMEEVLMNPRPRPYYCNSATLTTIIFSIIKHLPRNISDKCRLSIMKVYEHKTS